MLHASLSIGLATWSSFDQAGLQPGQTPKVWVLCATTVSGPTQPMQVGTAATCRCTYWICELNNAARLVLNGVKPCSHNSVGLSNLPRAHTGPMSCTGRHPSGIDCDDYTNIPLGPCEWGVHPSASCSRSCTESSAVTTPWRGMAWCLCAQHSE